jgi:TolA-binding protein
VDRVNPGGPAKASVDIEAYTKEMRVLQPARQAVARGDFGSALAAIADHQTQYPSGKLAEEREALRVKALLGLGRTAEAQRAGAAFRARFPRSALLKRIEELLETQK